MLGPGRSGELVNAGALGLGRAGELVNAGGSRQALWEGR